MLFYRKYKPIIVFYLLACLFSWPFFFWRDARTDSWESLGLHYVIKTSLVMWGPGIAAIICWFLFNGRVKRSVSLLGTSVLLSLIFWGFPFLLLVMAGLEDKNHQIHHIIPVQVLLGSFIYTLGEELGWRGYLQDQLGHLPRWKRYLLIGTLWEIWHFTTRTLSGPFIGRVLRPLLFILPMSVLSFLYGESVSKSRSVVIAVTLHTWVNLAIEYPQARTFVVLGISIPFWFLMIWKWDRIRAWPVFLRSQN